MKATVLVREAELDRGEVVLDGDRYRHLFRARRAASDSEFRLTDGAGRECMARVAEVSPDSARLVAEGSLRQLKQPPWLAVIVPVLKPQRTAWMVEKATELGVSEIRFYTGARAPRDVTTAAHARLGRVAAAALAQSHGAWLPRITAPEPLAEVVAALPKAVTPYLAVQGAPRLERAAVPAVWAIGAEGGWDEAEAKILRESGFTAVGLADGVLRAETAALAALAVGRGCATVD